MSEFDKAHLMLAFGHHVAQRVIAADRRIDPREVLLLHDLYPRRAMEAAGLVDAEGHFTDAFEEAAREGARALPALLSDEEKLDLLRWWRLVARADNRLDPAEDETLLRAGTLLGWDVDRIQRALAELAESQG